MIGNANYENAPRLANPGNDAQSIAELLNAAGFEVIAATDLRHGDMVKVLQDFSDKVAARGPNTVAMVYYAGHGVQLAGENYLIPPTRPSTTISPAAPMRNRRLRLQAQPKAVPLMQFTRLSNRAAFRPIAMGLQGAVGHGNIGGGKIVTMPAPGAKPISMPGSLGKSKVANLPAANTGQATSNPIMKGNGPQHVRTERQSMQINRTRFGGGRTALHATSSGSHVGAMGGGHRGGFRH